MARHEGPTTRSKTRAARERNRSAKVVENTSGDDEFPILKSLGLYAGTIKGDGNCLFRSLSDQYYGDNGDKHVEIRAHVVDYMRDHADYFGMFLGGVEFGEDESFSQYVDRMAQDGVYGDNLEIVAFARKYKVDIVIYQSDFMYVVSFEDGDQGSGTAQKLHIAYHTWEHYSSVRNANGPHNGLPQVIFKSIGLAGNSSDSAKKNKSPEWKVDVVKKSLSFALPDQVIRDKLEQYGGDISSTVEELIMTDPSNGTNEEFNSDQEEINEKENVAPETQSPTPTHTNLLTNGKIKPELKRKDNAKRLTAREKKEKQKRAALDRKRQKLAGQGTPQAHDDNGNELVEIKTMYV